ncbi:MAG TPA: hypothetical protein VHV08_09625 [Pirellulales bacterium]|jgi:hypothetical protein|nr:hypothetical protein [Pirellulales bacterium]
MNRRMWPWNLLIVAVAAVAMAQPPDNPGDFAPRGNGPPGGAGGDFRPPPNPLVEALDTDHDLEISAEEIKRAPKSLLALDKNKDHKLTEDELRPSTGRGPGGPPMNGPAANGRRTQGRGRQNSGGPPNPAQLVDHAMRFDADHDGKLSRDELAKFAAEIGRGGPPGGPGGGGIGPGPDPAGDTGGARPQRPRRPD